MIDQPLQTMNVRYLVAGVVQQDRHDRVTRAEVDDGVLTIAGNSGVGWIRTYAAGVWLTCDGWEVKP